MAISKRSAFHSGLFLPILAVLLAMSWASPAAANVLHPAGCSDEVHQPWATACWQGQYYVNYGTSVLGVQFVLVDSGYNPDTPDCSFGPKTDKATVLFQRNHGLDRDGIVGPATWGSLQSQPYFSGLTDTYGSFYNVGPDGLRFYYQSAFYPPTWFVLDPYYTIGYPYIAMVALVDGTYFCP
jgi:hypothetical protein